MEIRTFLIHFNTKSTLKSTFLVNIQYGQYGIGGRKGVRDTRTYLKPHRFSTMQEIQDGIQLDGDVLKSLDKALL